jgi:hypothetical protein
MAAPSLHFSKTNFNQKLPLSQLIRLSVYQPPDRHCTLSACIISKSLTLLSPDKLDKNLFGRLRIARLGSGLVIRE